MKKISWILVLSLFAANHYCAGQDFKAIYKVEQEINMPTPDGKQFSLSLPYEGVLAKAGANHIYFQKPLYLDKYPNGIATQSDKAGSFFQMELVMDTIQQISYNNTDSLTFRMSMESASSSIYRSYSSRKFEMGVHQWVLVNETKNIDGLHCQRAKLYRDVEQKELIWEIWFCPEIDIQFGPLYTRDLPGLLVEGTFFGGSISTVVKLISYDSEKLDQSIFWPPPFSNAKFSELPALKKPHHSTAPKTKDQKKAEIVNQ